MTDIRNGELDSLRRANQNEENRKVEEECRAEEERKQKLRETKSKENHFRSANEHLALIQERLRSTITKLAPAVSVSDDLATISLGQAKLVFTPCMPADPVDDLPFKVWAYSSVGITLPTSWRGMGHSLWYCDAMAEGDFKWFEFAFETSGIVRSSDRITPYALDPGSALVAVTRVMGTKQTAWWSEDPLVIGNIDDFVRRWGSWFGDGADGKLQKPRYGPINKTWRGY